MEKNNISTEILEKNLNRIIDLIKNCDTKVSYVLAITGIVISILFKVKTPNLYFIKKAISGDDLYWFFSIAILGLILTSFFCLKGIYCLTQALMAKSDINKENEQSLIFFGSIADKIKNGSDYLANFDSHNYDYREDLACQIYINSTICTSKFKNYVKGLNLLRWSLPILIICWSYLF